jgi:hypothetical protein
MPELPLLEARMGELIQERELEWGITSPSSFQGDLSHLYHQQAHPFQDLPFERAHRGPLNKVPGPDLIYTNGFTSGDMRNWLGHIGIAL